MTRDELCKIMCAHLVRLTDGRQIYMFPTWIEQYSDDELYHGSIIEHEGIFYEFRLTNRPIDADDLDKMHDIWINGF